MICILMSSDLIEFPCTWFLLIIIERDGTTHSVVGFLTRRLLDGSVPTRPINADSATGVSKHLFFVFILVKSIHLHSTLFSQRRCEDQGLFSLLLFQSTPENRTGLKG